MPFVGEIIITPSIVCSAIDIAASRRDQEETQRNIIDASCTASLSVPWPGTFVVSLSQSVTVTSEAEASRCAIADPKLPTPIIATFSIRISYYILWKCIKGLLERHF